MRSAGAKRKIMIRTSLGNSPNLGIFVGVPSRYIGGGGILRSCAPYKPLSEKSSKGGNGPGGPKEASVSSSSLLPSWVVLERGSERGRRETREVLMKWKWKRIRSWVPQTCGERKVLGQVPRLRRCHKLVVQMRSRGPRVGRIVCASL